MYIFLIPSNITVDNAYNSKQILAKVPILLCLIPASTPNAFPDSDTIIRIANIQPTKSFEDSDHDLKPGSSPFPSQAVRDTYRHNDSNRPHNACLTPASLLNGIPHDRSRNMSDDSLCNRSRRSGSSDLQPHHACPILTHLRLRSSTDDNSTICNNRDDLRSIIHSISVEQLHLLSPLPFFSFKLGLFLAVSMPLEEFA